jgi:hypothetical protein
MKTAAELKTWLEFHNCLNIRNVQVAIHGQDWKGCEYDQIHKYTSDMDAVTRGYKRAGDEYGSRHIYCLGELPLVYKPKRRKWPLNRICFPRDDGLDWYIAAYMPLDRITPEFSEFHPFGVNFMLCPWNIPNSKIDDGDKPYTRYPMTVTALP